MAIADHCSKGVAAISKSISLTAMFELTPFANAIRYIQNGYSVLATVIFALLVILAWYKTRVPKQLLVVCLALFTIIAVGVLWTISTDQNHRPPSTTVPVYNRIEQSPQGPNSNAIISGGDVTIQQSAEPFRSPAGSGKGNSNSVFGKTAHPVR